MTPLAPIPQSAEELQRFAELQSGLASMFRDAYADPRAPRTVVVVPSMSLDPEVLAKIDGVQFYEERMLSMFMLLRLPRTHVVYVTSLPLAPVIVDYYLHLLGGVPASHARSRLTLLSAYDASPRALTSKILERPRLLSRIRAAIDDPSTAHLSCFNSTERERTLAVQLGIPLYACDPALVHLGSKSGSREIFRAVGAPLPPGAEGLRDEKDLAAAIASLRGDDPSLRRVVVKLDEGFSGEGNAILDLADAPSDVSTLTRWAAGALRATLRCEAVDETPERYLEKFARMGGIVEAWVEGDPKRSPSVQMRVNALGELELISTHDQVLGGPSGQIFLGSTFPADAAYRDQLHEAGHRVGAELARRGVLGRFAVDFVAAWRDDAWELWAIEINLRKGGTTLPFQMLQFLTDGHYDGTTGEFVTPMGQTRAYYATDNLVRPAYRRFIPEDLIDVLVEHDLHFDETTQQGVVFNLIGALSEHGKLGLVCIASTHEAAVELSRRTIETLDREAEQA
ncbi:MAG: peptide ligase PGM1-related protein [Myxococcota bacterium]|nr:peptide ligase PGM1-related protein [Myxococcota bacterium]